jgi:uncharacterized peroxidase-related enzyme
MAWITTIEETDAVGRLAAAYRAVGARRGRVSNIMKAQSLNPGAMQAHLDLYVALMFDKSGLTREDREVVAVVVSAANRCAYCVSHHAEALRAYMRDEERIRALARDFRSVKLPERLRRIAEYADKLTRSPDQVAAADVAALRDAGLCDEEILGVNMVTAYFNFVNRIALGLGVTSSPEEQQGYYPDAG